MKNTAQFKKFIIAFVVSLFIFSLAALVIAFGLSIGRENDRVNGGYTPSDISGKSFNILLIMSDYAPEKFNDYHPTWVKNVVGEDISFPSNAPSSALSGYRKVYTENMVIACFDKERGRVTLTPLSGGTLVNVKGLSIRLEELAGEWGLPILTEKVHALTGLEIDSYAVFTPSTAAAAFDLIGDVDYTIKCNMKYDIPERGIDIDLSAGTYRLDGKTTVDMLRFDGYEGLGVTRSEITLGYAKRLFNKLSKDLTSDELRDIINKTLSLANTDFDLSASNEEITLISEIGKLSLESAEVVGAWQTVGNVRYFVLDETKTLNKLSEYRKHSIK